MLSWTVFVVLFRLSCCGRHNSNWRNASPIDKRRDENVTMWMFTVIVRVTKQREEDILIAGEHGYY